MPASGIEARHSRSCASLRARRCNCEPTYRASVWNGAEKRLVRKTFSGPDAKIEAELWRADAARARSLGRLHTPTRITVAVAADALLEGMADGSILDRSGTPYKPATVRSYRRGVEASIVPALGHLPLGAVTRGHVQALVDDLHGSGLAASTVRNRIDPLRVIFKRAKRRGEVTFDPTDDLEMPRGRGRRDRIATRSEADALIAALPASERALWATMFYGGLRRGEARALRWTDVDLAAEPAVIHVRRTWDDVDGEVTTKTEAGERTVPLTGRLRTLLADHGLTTGRTGDDLVFGRTATLPFIPTTARSRALRAWGWKQQRNADTRRMEWIPAHDGALEPLTPHEARHCCASYLIEAGLNDLELTATIGHSDPRTTKTIYGHLFPDSSATIAAKIDAYLDPMESA